MKSYPDGTRFSGKVLKIDFDLKPDFTIDIEQHNRASAQHAMLRQ